MSYATINQQDDTSDLQLSLVGPSPEEMKPTVATAMMEVISPATLSEGYEFETIAPGSGNIMKVTVPKGGVEKGQRFYIPVPTNALPSNNIPNYTGGAAASSSDQVSIPVGHWRDGILDCFKHGVLHSTLWLSCCCAPCAAGQVITRLNLDWLGRPVQSVAESTGAYKKIFAYVVSYIVIRGLLYWYLFYEEFEREIAFEEGYMNTPPASRYEYAINYADEPPVIDYVIAWTYDLMHYVYYFVAVRMIWNTRTSLRAKYAIPEQVPVLEDLACACVCPCITTAQMLRHTTDYERYQSALCTENGLKNGIVV